MALKKNENRVKFGLKRVAFALATIAEDGTATYGDVISFPGARTLSMEPQEAGEPWYADDGVYHFSSAPVSRQGDLEMARIIDAFKRQVLGYITDANGILLENMNPAEVHFALLFETMNDKRPRRYVLYNCMATAPTVGSATNEGTKEPQTETSTIMSTGVYVPSHGKWFDHGETTPKTDPEAYANWFNAVQVPGAPPDPYPIKTVSGNPIIITDAANMAVEAMSVAITPIQSGSGDPSPDNVRAISGWTGATVTRLGKNLANIADNTYTNSGVTFTVSGGAVQMTGASTGTINRTIGTVRLSAGVTYTISGTGASGITDANVLRIDLRNTGGSVIASGDSYNGFVYTPEEDVTAQVNIRLASGQTVDTAIYPQVEIGNTATEFEPYSPTIYTITFPAEAGTVYGGVLDVTRGLLTVDMVMITIDGSDSSRLASFNTDSSNFNRVQSNIYNDIGIANIMFECCDRFKPIALDSTESKLYKIWNSANAPRMFFGLPKTVTSIDEAKAWFAENPTHVVAKIASPQTYQLTPVEVRTLQGDNTIGADTGAVTMSYHSDPIFDD